MLGQLLHRQRRPRIAKVSGIEVKDPSSERGRLPLVRGLASSPIREPLFTFGLQAVAEPSNVTRREPSCLNGLLLRQLLGRTWRATWTRRSSLPFMTMLSSPTISSSLREPDSAVDILLWGNRILSWWDYSGTDRRDESNVDPIGSLVHPAPARLSCEQHGFSSVGSDEGHVLSGPIDCD